MTSRSTKNRNKNNFDPNDESVISEKTIIHNILTRKVNLTTKNKSQTEAIKIIKKNVISLIAGAAGTGKTYIALATALDLILDKNSPYTNIYLVKSVTTIPKEDIGFLKGELKDKVEPFMWSFMMNVNKLIGEKAINDLLFKGIVKTLPLAYIRGLSIDNSIVIMDETQNITLSTLRTLMTRIGENTKLIALGDTKQIDIKEKDKSSLKIAMKMFKDVNDIGIFEFSNDDIVRNPLIKMIEEKFDQYENLNYNQQKELLNG